MASHCSTLEEQLYGLYVADPINGGFKEASFNDVSRYLKMYGFNQTKSLEDRYYYFWTSIFILVVISIVYIIR